MNQNILEIRHLSKDYGTFRLEDVSFSLPRGVIMGLIGENGAGKSTLCRTITGLYRAMGTVQIDGTCLKRKRRTKQSFFVQQDADYQLYAPTVVDEFLIGKKETPELRQAALARLNEMDLEPFAVRHPTSLSGGQKQRLFIILALIPGPKVVFLDELTTGLDTKSRREVWKCLLEMKDKGLSICLVSHFMDEVEMLCDQIGILRDGMFVFEGTVKEAVDISPYSNLEDAYLWWTQEEENR